MIAAVFERLEASGAFRSVELAEDVDAMLRGTAKSSGTLFLVPWRERAGDNALASGGHRQRVEVQLLTGIVIRRDDDPRGAKRVVAFASYKEAVETALAGWQPAPGYSALELVGGEGNPFGDNGTIYIQTWETARYLQGA